MLPKGNIQVSNLNPIASKGKIGWKFGFERGVLVKVKGDRVGLEKEKKEERKKERRRGFKRKRGRWTRSHISRAS